MTIADAQRVKALEAKVDELQKEVASLREVISILTNKPAPLSLKKNG